MPSISHTTTTNQNNGGRQSWKIHAGGQDFSPKAQAFRDSIEFWKRIVSKTPFTIDS